MKKITQLNPEEVIESLAGVGTKEWNECLSKRLEPIRAYLDADEWKKGISVYLRAIQGGTMAKMLNQQLTPDGYQYYRGFIAGLRMAICLPETIEGHINQQETDQKKGVPMGNAGY